MRQTAHSSRFCHREPFKGAAIPSPVAQGPQSPAHNPLRVEIASAFGLAMTGLAHLFLMGLLSRQTRSYAQSEAN